LKKIILGLSLLLLATNSYAFKSGTYKCNIQGVEGTLILKPNGRAKLVAGIKVSRGYWQDDDDAAIVIKNDWIIEDKGNGNYILSNSFPCKKVK